jgi:rhamnulokinase
MNAKHYLAVDLGAESGRVMLGTLEDGRVALEEIHRFPNRTSTTEGHLRWKIDELEKEIFAGLIKAAERNLPIAGISADSWGVDYVLLDAEGNALAQPHCYRDARNSRGVESLLPRVAFPAIYVETGIQFMPINTFFQLGAEQIDNPDGLAAADSFLTIADYFNARVSGVRAVEQSLASTTQIFNPQTREWSAKLIEALGLPPALFPKLVSSGTVLGPVTGALKKRKPLAQALVIATCSHDTGAAVAAVPADPKTKWAYLSSGTWSLLGVELPFPVISEAAREANFTNEMGLGGTTRLLKNIAGLWVVQECRRAWETAGQTFSYEDLTRLAAESGPAPAHLSLDDPRFLSPGDMPEKIVAFCRETKQPTPASPGQFVRIILESLALTYAQTLGQLEGLIGYKIEKLHIVGGGTRNELLNQFCADATRLPVVTGPAEATAIGNILIQALALGHLPSSEHVRLTVEASFPTRTYLPGSGLTQKTTFPKPDSTPQ